MKMGSGWSYEKFAQWSMNALEEFSASGFISKVLKAMTFPTTCASDDDGYTDRRSLVGCHIKSAQREAYEYVFWLSIFALVVVLYAARRCYWNSKELIRSLPMTQIQAQNNGPMVQ